MIDLLPNLLPKNIRFSLIFLIRAKKKPVFCGKSVKIPTKYGYLVEVTGLEPTTSWSLTKRATKLRYTSMFSYVIVSVCDLFFLRRRGSAPLRSRILPAMAKFLFRIAHTIHRFVCSTQFSTLTKRFCQTARLLNESILYYNRNSESVKQFSRPIYGNFILPLKNK